MLLQAYLAPDDVGVYRVEGETKSMSAAPQQTRGAFMLASVVRDYSLTGPEAKRAAERGLIKAVWYRSPIARERIKTLMKRNDYPALLHLSIWLALLAGSGV
ncbi:MAG: hypothetical protein QOG17_493, partial [Gammaproteobacteria bacterium]|nr:hypothetical protein [Gammaproteobacteria bacterium]